ncbi:hypothetical protein B0H14DRAFT_2611434 [Mycena olivaceomarginata]|nr:hypothetical protein B0H14DRAFT_2611434 [Mycena olivaceomarginata]
MDGIAQMRQRGTPQVRHMSSKTESTLSRKAVYARFQRGVKSSSGARVLLDPDDGGFSCSQSRYQPLFNLLEEDKMGTAVLSIRDTRISSGRSLKMSCSLPFLWLSVIFNPFSLSCASLRIRKKTDDYLAQYSLYRKIDKAVGPDDFDVQQISTKRGRLVRCEADWLKATQIMRNAADLESAFVIADHSAVRTNSASTGTVPAVTIRAILG